MANKTRKRKQLETCHICCHLADKNTPSLCPYKVTVDWAMLRKEDREFILDQMKFLQEIN
jgi:hypothetical protein